jgi:hypothetical protein
MLDLVSTGFYLLSNVLEALLLPLTFRITPLACPFSPLRLFATVNRRHSRRGSAYHSPHGPQSLTAIHAFANINAKGFAVRRTLDLSQSN